MKRTEELTGLRNLTEQKLSAKIVEEQKQLAKLLQQKALGGLKNTREITAARKTIARIHTVLDEKLTAVLKEESK